VRTLLGMWRLVRPFNATLASASVLIGAFLAGMASPTVRVVVACLSAWLICGGGNALNDAIDREADRRNRPTRPVVSGQVEVRQAVALSLLLFAGGLFAAWWVGLPALVVAFCATGGLVLYDIRGKGLLGVANLVVSLVASLAFLYGALAAGQVVSGLTPMLFAFLYHLGREILKDVQDMPGDQISGIRTFPLVLGRTRALVLSFVSFAVLVALSPLPFLLNLYGRAYLVTVVIAFDLPLVLLWLWIWRCPSDGVLARGDRWLKLMILPGLLALYVGR
jgi:geranylgeranylglycerol-phosphate geranylgeranyltransferase